MKRTLLTVFLMSTLVASLTYGAAVIFSGSNVKALKQNLDLNGVGGLYSGTANPTLTATSANQGSLYECTAGGTIYKKNDNGSTTNWTALNSSSASVTSVGMSVPSFLSVSGSPITSSGTARRSRVRLARRSDPILRLQPRRSEPWQFPALAAGLRLL